MQTYLIKAHNPYSGGQNIDRIIADIGVEPTSIPILSTKSRFIPVMIKSVKTSWANIIKQEMLASGGDACISRNSYNCSKDHTDVLLLGTQAVLSRFLDKMQDQPECFRSLAGELSTLLQNRELYPVLDIGGKSFDLAKDTLILGVLNLTPDSFSDGGRYNDYDTAMKRAEELLRAGADIIDIGGESTRPGAEKLDAQAEAERVLPIIEAVSRKLGALVSIDSYKPEVIRHAISAGAVMVNDVSSGAGIIEAIQDIVKNDVAVISMMNLSKDGIRGDTTQVEHGPPVVESFLGFCMEQRKAFMAQGLDTGRIILDPGIGFGLSTNDISSLLNNIYSVTSGNIPVCMGLSRKSYLGRITGLGVDQRDGLGQAISLFLIQQGVRIFRTHEPKSLRDVMAFYKSIEGR